MKKKKVIVTGGAGFIGSHLVDELVNRKYDVIVIDNLINSKKQNLSKSIKKIKFYKYDIRDLKKIDKLFKNVETVFHLAALADIVPSIQSPEEYYSINVTGTLNILELCKKYNIKKFIYSASASCYGISKKFPTTEEAKISPEYPYALTKRLGEELVIHWGKVYNLNFTSLRFFNVYGPRSRTTGTYGAMFGVFLAQKLANKPFTVVGSGNQKRDFSFVSDTVDAIIKCSQSIKSKNKIYNVGTEKSVSINKIVSLLKGKKIHIPKRPGEPDITVASIKKIKNELNWAPKISIEKGIQILLQNIYYWSDAPVWTKNSIKVATKDWFKHLK